jgi:hypothetical protein
MALTVNFDLRSKQKMPSAHDRTLADKKVFKCCVRLAFAQVTKEHAKNFCYVTQRHAMRYIA